MGYFVFSILIISDVVEEYFLLNVGETGSTLCASGVLKKISSFAHFGESQASRMLGLSCSFT